MRWHELKMGRTLGVTFDHGDDFFPCLAEFCRANDLRQGYIPMFLAGFSEAEIVGTCEKPADPQAPVWTKVHLENVEAMGCGTLAYQAESGRVLPHVHTTLGLKFHGATAHTSHLLSARVLFLVELLVVEVVDPMMTRPRNAQMYDIPLLTFTPSVDFLTFEAR